MPDTSFDVTRFVNRNGVTSWRVSGWLHGLRFRKNFKTREEAGAERAALEAKAAQAAAGVRLASTFLSEDQLRDCESAIRRLADKPKPLSVYLDYAFAHYRAPEREITIDDAATAYLATKQQEHDRGMLSLSQLKDIRVRLVTLKKAFPEKMLSALTRESVAAHCHRGNASPKTFNNRRGVLHTFFKYAYNQDWLVVNPLEKVPHLRIGHRRGSAKTLTAEQCEKLMRYIETFEGGVFVPYFCLCLFAGIRPSIEVGEISKLRPESVHLETGAIMIEPEVSKVRMKRNVTIQPNLAAWLRAYPLSRFPIIPKNATNLRRGIAEKFGLSHDIMRHTFISMHVAKYRSMGEAALQAGNSESIIRKHYLDLKTPAEAEQFFAIMPTPVAATVTSAAPPTALTASACPAVDALPPSIPLPIAA